MRWRKVAEQPRTKLPIVILPITAVLTRWFDCALITQPGGRLVPGAESRAQVATQRKLPQAWRRRFSRMAADDVRRQRSNGAAGRDAASWRP
jgi:hypothetical protein